MRSIKYLILYYVEIFTNSTLLEQQAVFVVSRLPTNRECVRRAAIRTKG